MKQVYKLNKATMVPQWKQLYAHKIFSAGSSISISVPAVWLLFFSSLTPSFFSHSLCFLLTFSMCFFFIHLQMKPISTVSITDLGLSSLCFSRPFSASLSFYISQFQNETTEREDDVWQLPYFDLLSVRLILTQWVFYQGLFDCVWCVFISLLGVGAVFLRNQMVTDV